MSDAVERLRDYAINKWTDGVKVKDARAILDHIASLTAERDAAISREQRAVADVVAYLRGEGSCIPNTHALCAHRYADAIASGAYKGQNDVAI